MADENFLTATEELIKTTSQKLTKMTQNNEDYIPPANELNALAVLITARANYAMSIRYYASSRGHQDCLK